MLRVVLRHTQFHDGRGRANDDEMATWWSLGGAAGVVTSSPSTGIGAYATRGRRLQPSGTGVISAPGPAGPKV